MAEGSLPGGVKFDLPRLTLALVQSEGQMLRTPAYDLTAFLAEKPQWRVESFTERTINGLLNTMSHFSCIILGFNVLHRNPEIVDSLKQEALPPNLLVLHQKTSECFAFLTGEKGELKLELHDLFSDQARAVAAVERKDDAEALLSWPEYLPGSAVSGADELLDCSVNRYFSFGLESAWQPVLEVRDAGDRRPVLLKTAPTAKNRVVVSSLKLEPRDERHAKLLENMVTYCAWGRPEIAVVQRLARGGATALQRGSLAWNAGIIVRRLRLQGANALEVYLPHDGDVDFGRWPLRGVHRVVLAGSGLSSSTLSATETERWLASGGTLIELAESSRLMVQSGASEAHWVAQRWATWFNATDPATWQDHISRLRAVLRVLDTLREDRSHAHPERLGLPQPSDYVDTVATLARNKIRDGNHDDTVSMTAGVYDLMALVGLDSEHPAPEIRHWLDARFQEVPLEDKFDIARCLASKSRFAEALEEAKKAVGLRELSAVCHMRMRQAAIACHTEDDNGGLWSAMRSQLANRSSLGEFDDRMLLSAEFITALVNFASCFPNQEEVLSESADRAIATIADRGSLARPERGLTPSIDPEVISMEALALLAYSTLTNESTLLIRPELNDLPVSAVEPVLEETKRARDEAQRARASLAEETGELRKTLRTLATAQLLFGGITLVAAVSILAGVITLANERVGGVLGLAAVGVLILATIAAMAGVMTLAQYTGRRKAAEAKVEENALAAAQAIVGALSIIVALAALAAVVALLRPSLVSTELALVVSVAGVVFMLMAYVFGRVELSPAWTMKVDEVVRGIPGLPRTLASLLKKPPESTPEITEQGARGSVAEEERRSRSESERYRSENG